MSYRLPIRMIFILAIFASCEPKRDGTVQDETAAPEKQTALFKMISPDSSGVRFANHITQTFALNVYTYAYLFNGGGVATGDINNDGLPDIYFTSTIGEDKLYLNKGNLTFEDISAKAGIANFVGIKTGVTMADINNDGYLDIYVCRSGPTKDEQNLNNLVFINNQDLTFTEQASSLGLLDKSNSTQAYFADFDEDGDLDIYLVNHRIDFTNSTKLRLKQNEDGSIERILGAQTAFESDRLFRNDGRSFSDVSKAAGIDNSAFGLSASIGDFNNDGHLDIYVANDYVDPDFCYINNGDGTFRESMEKIFRHISQSTMGTDAADVNNDGLIDIVAADMASESNFRQKSLISVMMYDRFATMLEYNFGKQLSRNTLQINNGNGSFSEVGEFAGLSRTDWSWSPTILDLDNDGYKDIFITNGYRFEVTNHDYLKFTLDSLNKNVGLSSAEKLEIFLSKIPTSKLSNYAFRNEHSLKFSNKTSEWGLDIPSNSTGASFADLDGDGDLDMIINNTDDFASVYENLSNDALGNNYLKVNFDGKSGNLLGVGSRVEVTTNEGIQVQEYFPSRGFISGVSSEVHFGLGKNKAINQVRVIWPDKKEEIIENPEINQTLTFNYVNSNKVSLLNLAKTQVIFEELAKDVIDFTHSEAEFIDFKREPLIPHLLSCEGPILAVADINNDGLDDLFVGGGGGKANDSKSGQAGVIFLQRKDGTFSTLAQPALEADRLAEDVGALFFDADNDGDQDLYVVSGSNEYDSESPLYQDRLYTNDGSGRLQRKVSALPNEVLSGSCVKAADFDGDGDLDLFVGSKLLPGSYPKAPGSLLLKNEGGTFKNVSATFFPKNWKSSMVFDAVWCDLNNDKRPDLIIVGEWMPITIFENTGNSFEMREIENSTGWWNCIEMIDHDQDGDTDFVIGNLGLNSRLKASPSEPLRIYYDDFDSNGSVDAIISYYNEGQEYPLVQKDLLLSQLPVLKKKYVTYNSYASATIQNLLSNEQLAKSNKKEAVNFSSSILENLGGGSFKLLPLPEEAQLAPIRSILKLDYDANGTEDLLLLGNSFGTEVETGVYDALNGVLLKNTNGNFRPVHFAESGFFAPGDGRSLAQVKTSNEATLVIAAYNNAPLRIWKINK